MEPVRGINTARVKGRRSLHFACQSDILRDVESVAAGPFRCLGNWSLAQICRHLAQAMDWSLGLEPDRTAFPLWLRVVGRLFNRLVVWYGVRLQPGYRLGSAERFLEPAPGSTEEGLRDLAAAIRRLAEVTVRRPRHPVWGKFSRSDWDQYHCRHAEMHLSFIVPLPQT